eukprot:TRINITY_DN2474_c0_g2_i1.p1 TRINITY_DN2474_c0_g2~~TRINITY_DN2474_c0_g2_i1.p1  ORF type:complete len:508 (-),score=208.20 TRINITY_DN2474_c0_g2_i1:62-1585(-)
MSISVSPNSSENKKPDISSEEIKVFECIGKGFFGCVFRGKCRGKEVAVKQLFQRKIESEVLESFRKEVEICSLVHHPNVVLFMGACTETDNLFIVTELMPKGNVESYIRDKKNNITSQMRLKMALDAALGMNWLHCSNPQIIHRDLKPSNLMIDANGIVKVGDFGLSTIKNGRYEKPKGKGLIGTPLWMAPELFMGGTANDKTDVYSFSIILWELVTGEEPFADLEDELESFKRAVSLGLRPEIPEDMNPALKSLIERSWRAASKRPSFAQIIDELEAISLESIFPDQDALTFWKNNFHAKDKVLWDDFATNLAEFLDMGCDFPYFYDIRFKCLRALIAKQQDKTLKDPPLIVTNESFGYVLGYFGPLLSKDGQDFLTKIHSCLEQKWFHGTIEKEQAEELLKGKLPGTFLVRLSSTKVGSFTITKLNKKRSINHQRISFDMATGFSISSVTSKGKKKIESSSIVGLIDKVKGILELEEPCTGSPYRNLFGDGDEEETSGYVYDAGY